MSCEAQSAPKPTAEELLQKAEERLCDGGRLVGVVLGPFFKRDKKDSKKTSTIYNYKQQASKNDQEHPQKEPPSGSIRTPFPAFFFSGLREVRGDLFLEAGR